MNVLEVIHLRMAGDDVQDLVEVLRRALGSPGGGVEGRIYVHPQVPGDLLIHIQRDRADQGDGPSALGLRLADLLRLHGLVEHGVWVRAGDGLQPIEQPGPAGGLTAKRPQGGEEG